MHLSRQLCVCVCVCVFWIIISNNAVKKYDYKNRNQVVENNLFTTCFVFHNFIQAYKNVCIKMELLLQSSVSIIIMSTCHLKTFTIFDKTENQNMHTNCYFQLGFQFYSDIS